MWVKLVGEDGKEALASFLDGCGWTLDGFDLKTNTLICQVDRRGQTDEDIAFSARVVRVAITVILSLYTGLPVSPGIRYRIVG